jgi:hypothetical protein
MMHIQQLMQPTALWLHVLTDDESKMFDRSRAWERESKGRLIVRQVRGARARSEQALFDEFAAAWQFPPYFGNNWDALEECLADLAWLPAQAYVLVMRTGLAVLESESEKDQARFWSVVARVAQGWNITAEGTSCSFQVIAQCEPRQRQALMEKLANTPCGSALMREP